MLRFKSLGSGSTGNATVVQASEGGLGARHLLVDCGLPLSTLDRRLREAGMLADQIDAVFVTHEHGDHIGSALQLALRERVPVWMSAGTYLAIGEPDFDGLLRIAGDGESIGIGSLLATPFSVPHDAREPLQLRLTDGDTDFAVLTDLGHVTPQVMAALAGVRAMLLECNHDPEMLATSRYPEGVKRRIGGAFGHLPNPTSARIATALVPEGLSLIVAAHLSRQNNSPELVRATLQAAVGGAAEIRVADDARGCDWLRV